MEIIIYLLMFSIGVTLGSFYTLAVYRIPLKQDITHTRSYCPKCNHKLVIWDLIPVLSYILLGGKCRYCKEKIGPRYIIIEVLSGIVFLLFAIFLNINWLHIEYVKIITLFYGMFFLSAIFIIIGIFKEHKKIEISVLKMGLVSELIYMVYLYILDKSIYRYIIYIPLLILAILCSNKKTNECAKILYFIIFIVISVYEIFVII